MWDRRGGKIVRVADTLIISVSQPSEAAVWGDGPAAVDCRTGDCRTAAVAGDGSPPGSGTWLGSDRDTVEGLDGAAEEPGSGTWLGSDRDTVGGLGSAVEEPAAAEGDGIQIICRFDSPWAASPCSSPPPYPPPPPPIESTPTLTALSRDVSEFSSIIEIDGDSFCIRSRLAGREEPETPSSEHPASSGANREDGISERDGDVSDDSDSEDEVAALVAQCRRFCESRLPPRWPALPPTEPADADELTSAAEEAPDEEDEEEERPTSVDSGRESGADSRSGEDGESKRTGPPQTQTQTQSLPQSQSLSQSLPQSQTQSQSPLEAKMAILRREVSSLMRQDNDLFHQLLSLHDSIEALKNGDGSLSAGSSMSSLADIEEEDTISTPSSDLDRQSHLSSEADNISLVKGDSGSERSFFSEILHVTGMSHWAKSRLAGPESLTAEQMAPPSPRQAAPPSPPSPAEKVAQRSRHRKQGSCDSGIVDQEIRGQA